VFYFDDVWCDDQLAWELLGYRRMALPPWGSPPLSGGLIRQHDFAAIGNEFLNLLMDEEDRKIG
jgi:hypothetical protein